MSYQSILEKEYVEQKRPYSQNELKNKRSQLYNKLKLSKIEAEHSHCGHFYKVRKNGRKEKEIIESNNNDSGNCSICWKINKIKNKFLQEKAKDLVYEYSNCFYNRPNKPFLTYDMVNLETTYYTWLYEDIQSKKEEETVEHICLTCD